MPTAIRFFALCAAVIFFTSCQSPQPNTEQVLIAPLSSDGRPQENAMTRQELEDHVRRFADRYFARIVLTANEFAEQTASDRQRALMHNWKTVSQAAIVDIAIGQNAVQRFARRQSISRRISGALPTTS